MTVHARVVPRARAQSTSRRDDAPPGEAKRGAEGLQVADDGRFVGVETLPRHFGSGASAVISTAEIVWSCDTVTTCVPT